MKSMKFMLAVVVLAALSVAAFSFVSKEKVMRTTFTKKFKYIGPNGGTPMFPTYAVSDVETPSNWQDITSLSPTCSGTRIFVCTVFTVSSQVYSGGPNNGLPKVDVTGTIQTDVLTASQAGTVNHVQPVADNGTDQIDVHTSKI
jgi:hypothetical protein